MKTTSPGNTGIGNSQNQVQRVKAGVSGERRAADGTESVLVVAAQRRMWLRRQIGQEWMNIGSKARVDFGPMAGSGRRAAVMTFAASGLEFKAAGAVIMHWLPHATGMWQRSRYRQGHGGKRAHEQQNEQQSGGQAVHGWFVVR